MEQETDYAAIRAAIIERENIKVTAVFIPFSQSRNKGEKNKSLNWKVSIWRGDMCAVTTDYSAGCGHCPSYKQHHTFANGKKDAWKTENAIAVECEHGRKAKPTFSDGHFIPSNERIDPDCMNVLYSIITDSDVLDFARFEDWAQEYGLNPDSIKDEKIYRDCLEIALQVRSVFGESLMSELREAFQDY